MTAQHQVEPLQYARRAPKVVAWLAGQWPKGAIIFAIVLTFAWVTLLVWAFNRMLDLF